MVNVAAMKSKRSTVSKAEDVKIERFAARRGLILELVDDIDRSPRLNAERPHCEVVDVTIWICRTEISAGSFEGLR